MSRRVLLLVRFDRMSEAEQGFVDLMVIEDGVVQVGQGQVIEMVTHVVLEEVMDWVGVLEYVVQLKSRGSVISDLQ